jgi:hypothetical protein
LKRCCPGTCPGRLSKRADFPALTIEELQSHLRAVVNELYRENDRIVLADNAINGEPVSPYLYAAISGCIRKDSGLSTLAKAGAVESQLMVTFNEREKVFRVTAAETGHLTLDAGLEVVESAADDEHGLRCCGGHCSAGAVAIPPWG